MSTDLRTAILAEMAEEATGLSDFGGDEWSEGLDRLLHAIEHEAELHDMGREVAKMQVVGALTTRLRIIDWHRSHPELAAAPVAAPIVILGQPRTGTTILFDLLAQDPAFRAPLTWEVADPIPPPQTATFTTDDRIAASQAGVDLSSAILPEFQSIHPTGAQRAQECVAITAADFRSLQWPTVFNIGSYTQWLLHEADHSSAYRYHRQFLQALQSDHAGERWLLKTPAHQWHLADLFAAYPDATIIHTHRDPLKVVASVASLTSVLHRLSTDHISLPAIAADWMDHLTLGCDRSVEARVDGTVPPGQAIDVGFAELVGNTMGTIEAIYEQLGRALTEETAAAMQRFLADNASDKHGVHTYGFDDTKLNVADCRARTERYASFFDVPRDVH